MEEKKKKIENLREKIKKEEKEKKLITNNLYRIDKNKEKRKTSFDETVSKIYEWEIKRKEKINKKRKDIENNIQNNIRNIPEINKNKKYYKIKANKFINRLYKDDISKRKENQEILNNIYTPQFQPLIIENNSLAKINTNINESNKIPLNKKNNNFICNSLNPNIFTNYNSLSNNYMGIKGNDYGNKYIVHLIRKRIFSKIKKKEPKYYRTEMRLDNFQDDMIDNNKNYDYNKCDSNNNCDYCDVINNNNKINSIYSFYGKDYIKK